MKIVFLNRVVLLFFMFSTISIYSAGSAALSTDALSGEYRLHFEQVSKSCGSKISPVDVNVEFVFSESNVTMKFPSGFLGIDILNAKFDSQTGSFNDQLKQSVNLGSTQANLTLNINGKLANQSSNPEIRFDVSFDKTADDPDWNCKVTGKGVAKKL